MSVLMGFVSGDGRLHILYIACGFISVHLPNILMYLFSPNVHLGARTLRPKSQEFDNLCAILLVHISTCNFVPFLFRSEVQRAFKYSMHFHLAITLGLTHEFHFGKDLRAH